MTSSLRVARVAAFRRAACVAILCLVACADNVSAQVPPVTPNFPHNLTLEPGRLYYRRVGLGRNGHMDWHNGSLYTANVTGNPTREFKFSSLTNPGSLYQITSNSTVAGFSEHDTHGHTKVGPWLGNAIMRSGVNVNVIASGSQRRPGFTQPKPANAVGSRAASHTINYPWALPFHWSQYGSSNGWGWIYRGNTLLHEWDLLGQTGILGNTIMLGNLIFNVSNEEANGVAAMEMSPLFRTPSEPPELLDKLSGHIGAYMPAIWEHYLILVRRDHDVLQMIDISDPNNLYLADTIPLQPRGNVPYVQFQDNYAFVWGNKVNLETRQVELVLDGAGTNRPAGSVTGALDLSQYNLPLGNLLITGGYSTTGEDGIGVWAHQGPPDTKRPYVGYHVPRSGQTNFPLGAPISILIHETLESYTIINGETVILRQLGSTTPIDCWVSFSHDDVLTITPKQYLASNTNYEVVIVDGGIKDASGNGIMPYTFTFSTGSTAAGNKSPVISSFTPSNGRPLPGATVAFTTTASDPENDTLEYRFIAGDGTAPTAWGSSSSFSHTYPTVGRYEAKVQVRDNKPGGATSQVSRSVIISVVSAAPATLPTHSGTLVLDAANRRIYTVNPDNDSVSSINADTLVRVWERNLATLLGIGSASVDPRNVALDAYGQLWVSAHDHDAVVVLNATDGSLVQTIPLGHGSAPYGVLASPDRQTIFVTVQARGIAADPSKGAVIRYNAQTRTESLRRELGPTARAMAMTSNATRLFVTRFISPENYGEVWEVNPSTMVVVRTIRLWRDRGDRGFDTGGSGKGTPNYVASITISPDNQWAWYTAQKPNTQRGGFFKQGTGYNQLLSPDGTVRALVGRINLTTNNEPDVDKWSDQSVSNKRLDVDNSDSPTSVTFNPQGDYAFVTLQGNNDVAIYDHLQLLANGPRVPTWRISAGSAPQGVLLDSATGRLWVQNFMGRDLTVHELSGFLSVGSRSSDPTSVSAIGTEKLSSTILQGKKLFYHASDKMSFETYMSCATCHVDGGHDGRTYDFTQRGEGLRNTTDLRGRMGMGHGNVHWTANFNEIQDFILDIMNDFGGSGFLPAGETPHASLSTSNNANRSTDLDALAAYVSSLGGGTLPRSPHRNADGTFTDAALRGATVFTAQGCASCHNPMTNYTNSTVGLNVTLSDVGTLRDSSGARLAGVLNGIDTPTLLGVWATAPYFHDGSAEALADVFEKAGGYILQAEHGALSSTSESVIDVIEDPVANNDASLRGTGVEFKQVGARVSFVNADGGGGGTGAVELRYSSRFSRTVRLIVNGTNYDLVVPGTSTDREWRRVYFPNVALTAGNTNTIAIEAVTVGFLLDDITVTTPDDFTLAQPHRRVRNLTTTDRADLMAYLLQLDGANASAPVSPAGTLANWDFSGNAGAVSSAVDSAAIGVTASSASLAAGLNANNYNGGNGLTGSGQTSTTLAGALSGNDYISFTLTPASGKSITVSALKLRPVSQNTQRTFAVFSSVGGFASGNEITTFTHTGGNNASERTITISGISNRTTPVEFRIYIYGQSNQYEAVGLGNSGGNDLVVEGTVQ